MICSIKTICVLKHAEFMLISQKFMYFAHHKKMKKLNVWDLKNTYMQKKLYREDEEKNIEEKLFT